MKAALAGGAGYVGGEYSDCSCNTRNHRARGDVALAGRSSNCDVHPIWDDYRGTIQQCEPPRRGSRV